MKVPQPSLDEWRRLYQAASTFKEAAPWEWMAEADVFGVQNPESRQIGYGSIMGMAGEHYALAVYLESEGLEGFWRLHEDGDLEPTFLLEVPQLQASWEDRRELHRQDREVIKALRLKFRGRKAWPMFRSIVPGFLPWFVTPEEARFLALALEQALEVSLRVEKDPDLLAPLDEGVYLVRIPVKRRGTLVWQDKWMEPEPFKARPLPPLAVTDADLAALRRLPRRKITVQADLFVMSSYIQESADARPYLAYNLMTVDARSGMILGADVLAPKPTLDAVWAKAPEVFLKILRRMGSRPTEVAVSSERLYRLLEPVTAGLGIRLTLKPWLPTLEGAKAALAQLMG